MFQEETQIECPGNQGKEERTMAIVKYNPFRDLRAMQDQMNRLLDMARWKYRMRPR